MASLQTNLKKLEKLAELGVRSEIDTRFQRGVGGVVHAVTIIDEIDGPADVDSASLVGFGQDLSLHHAVGTALREYQRDWEDAVRDEDAGIGPEDFEIKRILKSRVSI